MKKYLVIIKNILTTSKAKTFYWHTLNGFIGVLISGATEIDWKYIPVVIAMLNFTTKYINKR